MTLWVLFIEFKKAFCPLALREVSVIAELLNLKQLLLPGSNFPSGSVLGSDHAREGLSVE